MKISIDYIDKLDRGDIVEPIYAKEDIETNCTKRYHNSIYLLAGLSSLERTLMDFICEYMNKENVVYNDSFFKAKFKAFYNDALNKTVEEASINTMFMRLSKKNFLISIARGTYKVNPKYFWRGEDKEKNRVNEFKIYLEIKAGTKTIINN